MRGKHIPDLAAVRESRGVSLEQIAQSTKICAFYLLAIESGNLERLPGGIYTKSYVRQYARAIDYDETDLMDTYGLLNREEGAAARERHASGLERLGSFVTGLLSGPAGHAGRIG